MAIEIDYLAWEKWQPDKHRLVQKIDESYGFNSFVHNGVIVATVFRAKNQDIPTIYAFVAEDETAPITKLLALHHFYRNIGTERYYIDEIDIDEKTADAFHQDFLQMPSPTPISTGVTDISHDNYYRYELNLNSRYGGKFFSLGIDYRNFDLPNGFTWAAFDAIFNRIIERCHALSLHRYPKTEPLRQAIKAYESLFRSKAKYMKHQGRWPKPKILTPYERLYESFLEEKRLLDRLESKDAKEWGNQLDFKHDLSSFLKYLAFSYEFEDEHAELIFSKMKEADFQNWDEDERHAIAAYCLAFFQYNLAYYPAIRVEAAHLMQWLIALGLDLQPFLDIWESQFPYVDSLRHLAHFLRSLIEKNIVDSLPETLVDWLAKPIIDRALLNALATYQNKRSFAPEFSEALENLQLIRAYHSAHPQRSDI